jgi:hypothetical protein
MGMIFIMGIFVSFVVLCGTFRAKEEAMRRRRVRKEEAKPAETGSAG